MTEIGVNPARGYVTDPCLTLCTLDLLFCLSFCPRHLLSHSHSASPQLYHSFSHSSTSLLSHSFTHSLSLLCCFSVSLSHSLSHSPTLHLSLSFFLTFSHSMSVSLTHFLFNLSLCLIIPPLHYSHTISVLASFHFRSYPLSLSLILTL